MKFGSLMVKVVRQLKGKWYVLFKKWYIQDNMIILVCYKYEVSFINTIWKFDFSFSSSDSLLYSQIAFYVIASFLFLQNWGHF